MALLCQYLGCLRIIAFVPNKNDFTESQISAHPIYRKDGAIMTKLLTSVKTVEYGTIQQIGSVINKPKESTFFMLGSFLVNAVVPFLRHFFTV